MLTLASSMMVASVLAAAPPRVVFGNEQPATANIRVVDVATGNPVFNILPYGPQFTGGVRVAMADIDRDGSPDILTGAGSGANGHVKVFSGQTGAELRSFFAFPGFGGDVFVAFSDISGDGQGDIIVGAGAGAVGGHVKVFDGASGAEIRSFLAFPGFSGGVRVAAGDVNGDGRPDLVVANGPGAAAHIRVFDGITNQEIGSFLPYSGFTGGVFVAAGDVDGDGRAEIVTATDSGTAGHVKVFSGRDSSLRTEFFPYATSFMGGVRVALGDVTGDGVLDLIVGAGPGAAFNAMVYPGPGLATSFNLTPYTPSYSGGTFVGGVVESHVLLANGFE